jgi:hypothetical protein
LKKVFIAVPSFGHLDPMCEKSVRVAMMSAAHFGTVWIGDLSPDRRNHSAGRNLVARTFLDPSNSEGDGIMWIDADIVVPDFGISALMHVVENHGVEFVTGVYYQRGAPFTPQIYTWNPVTQKYQPLGQHPEKVVAPIQGCGFGFCYTSRRCLEAIRDATGWDPKREWFPYDRDRGGLSEDLNFCLQASKARIQLWVNTAVELDHCGDAVRIGKKDWEEDRAKNAPGSE